MLALTEWSSYAKKIKSQGKDALVGISVLPVRNGWMEHNAFMRQIVN